MHPPSCPRDACRGAIVVEVLKICRSVPLDNGGTQIQKVNLRLSQPPIKLNVPDTLAREYQSRTQCAVFVQRQAQH